LDSVGLKIQSEIKLWKIT
jgi:hypothetical protein